MKREFITELINMAFPPNERNLPVQDDSPVLMLLINSFHNINLLGLIPTQIPKNLKGNVYAMHERKDDATSKLQLLTLIP